MQGERKICSYQTPQDKSPDLFGEWAKEKEMVGDLQVASAE